MKILYILNSTKPDGGATKSFLTLLDGVIAKGITPVVVMPDNNGIYKVLINKGITVKVLDYRMNVYPKLSTAKDYLMFIPRLFARRIMEYNAVKLIMEICKEHEIDLIHSNVGLVSCGLSAAKKLNIPHILHIREYGDKDFGLHYFPTKSSFYKNICFPKSYVICITKGIAEYHHLSGSNVRVIYNGICCDSHSEHSEFYGKKFFLFAGRVEAAKGTMQVVEAFSLLLKESGNMDVTLKLAGSLDDELYVNKIRSYISQKGLEEYIEFLGPRNDLDLLMHDSLAIIVSSSLEAFGRCLPEAMLNNCLTVGRNTGGTKEQYDNGVQFCGEEIGLRYETTEELCDVFKNIINSDEHEYDRMKENAYNTVFHLYDHKNYVDSVYSFYKEILL